MQATGVLNARQATPTRPPGRRQRVPAPEANQGITP